MPRSFFLTASLLCLSLWSFGCGGAQPAPGPEAAGPGTQAPAATSEAPVVSAPTSLVVGPGSITPDAADTALSPPSASDLARYTSDIPGEGGLNASLKTDLGTIRCALYPEQAPVTVANFVGLARGLKAWKDPASGEVKVGTPLYAGTMFHRVIPKFMIQGGDPLGTGTGGPGYQFGDEFAPELRHDKPGRLSMANSGPGTNGSQFFVTEVATPHLDGKHTIFGQCDNEKLVRLITSSSDIKVKLLEVGFYR